MVGRQFQLSHALAAAFCLPCSLSLLFAARQTIIISVTKYSSGPCKNLPNSSDSQIGLGLWLHSILAVLGIFSSNYYYIISKLDSISTVLLPIPGAHNPEQGTPILGLCHSAFYRHECN